MLFATDGRTRGGERWIEIEAARNILLVRES